MQFFPSSGRVGTAVWMHYMDANKTYGEKVSRQLNKNAASNIEEVLEAAPHKASVVKPLATHHKKLSKLDEPDMRDPAGEVGMNSLVTCFGGPLHMDEQRQDVQLEPTYNCSVPPAIGK